ncbi:SAM-dependent methyltransferase [Cordyceps javanica]|uniref:SAM-dependent methyltransferase n=1 Tax=Cordyceps javanica TaxID=43265 RepID=A0A545URP1_9HYPO|nr:SAM-dependent methyltransferase [Cordyceps javanica]
MAPFKEKPDSSQYQRLLLRDDGDGCSTPFENRASSDGDHSAASHQGLDGLAPSKPSQLPRLILYFSFALALLSAVNIALLPATLARYRDYPLSDSDLAALPHGAAGVGLEHVADFMPPSPVYRYSWPDRIARVSRKMKSAVWGQGKQVYITVEDSTIMRFPIPSDGADTCLLSWRAPPELSVRSKDLTTKGDISEIEIWQLIAPSTTSANAPSSIEELDYDTLSYSSLPVRGELLGVLDLTQRPNSTTREFACPGGVDNLVVELRCQRVACHVGFMQLDISPILGFELLRTL